MKMQEVGETSWKSKQEEESRKKKIEKGNFLQDFKQDDIGMERGQARKCDDGYWQEQERIIERQGKGR